MARMVLLLALCVLPALVSAARHVANPLVLEGKVYCDTCRAGYETALTTPISGVIHLSLMVCLVEGFKKRFANRKGAKVKVECKDRNTETLLYSIDGETNEAGKYTIMVKEDHKDQLCDAMLVSSPQSDCQSADPGRDRARVILTRNNGMTSDTRFANAMGFMKDEPLSGCKQLLQQYELESQD